MQFLRTTGKYTKIFQPMNEVISYTVYLAKQLGLGEVG